MTSSDDLAATSWRRVGPPLLWHREPGSGAVFDPASGQTHFLNELPAMLLAEIQADWRDGASLVEQAAESFLLWRGVMPETASVIAALRTA